MPRVMVEGFLKEYLEVGEVVGSELQVIGGCFFTGFISSGAAKSKTMMNLFSEKKADVGLISYCNPHDQLFVPHCKAANEARYDKEAVIKFFCMLIKRRYFSDDLPAPSPWSLFVQKNSIHSGDSSSEEDKLHNRLRTFC